MLNFARVMAINPDLIILDEVTSHLSYETEMLIKNAIEKVSKNKITILIAHRLSTIKDCNQIIIMKNGKIIEHGNHEELLKTRKEYYRLVNNNGIK